MVWNSSQPKVAQLHRGLAQLLKEKRAEGHFVGLPLEQRIQVYDSALPAHAHSLKVLGLAGRPLPSLCLTTLDSKGLPQAVLWTESYSSPQQAMQSLNQRLGIVKPHLSKEPPSLVVVGSEGNPVWMEIRAKLKALHQEQWSAAPLQKELQFVGEHPLLEEGEIALIQAGKAVWKRPWLDQELALQMLGQHLGLSYKPPDQLLWEKDGSILRRVSGSRVQIGRDLPAPNDAPRVDVQLAPNYYLGKTEVTVAQYRAFVEATGYRTDAEKAGRSFVFQEGKFRSLEGASWRHPKGRESQAQANHPVVHMTLSDAAAYCQWAGLRLPDEAEWENGTGGKDFPWGAQWNANACRHSVGLQLGGSGGPLAVGSFPEGASPWGCLDMAGNVYEWTTSIYQPYLPGGPSNSRMNGLRTVIRGGSFGNEESSDFLTYRRTAVGSQDSTEAQGFRVCLGRTRSAL